MYKYVFEYLFSIFFCYIAREELESHCLNFLRSATLFSTAVHFTSNVSGFSFLHIFTNTCYFAFYYTHPSWCEMRSICSLSGGGGEAAAAADSLSSPHTPPDLPSFLLPQSHPQLQQSAFLDSASSRSTLRGKSRAHHQALGPWHVLPLSGSGGWQGSALTTQELGKQILPICTNAPKTALATIGCVFGKVI